MLTVNIANFDRMPADAFMFLTGFYRFPFKPHWIKPPNSLVDGPQILTFLWLNYGFIGKHIEQHFIKWANWPYHSFSLQNSKSGIHNPGNPAGASGQFMYE
jgi:hypothetical protein